MKRALHRAQSDQVDNATNPTPPPSHEPNKPSHSPPTKQMRISPPINTAPLPTPTPASTTTTTTTLPGATPLLNRSRSTTPQPTPASSSSGPSLSRRASSSSQSLQSQSSNSASEPNGWFLMHQNRALAQELLRLKRLVSNLQSSDSSSSSSSSSSSTESNDPTKTAQAPSRDSEIAALITNRDSALQSARDAERKLDKWLVSGDITKLEDVVANAGEEPPSIESSASSDAQPMKPLSSAGGNDHDGASSSARASPTPSVEETKVIQEAKAKRIVELTAQNNTLQDKLTQTLRTQNTMIPDHKIKAHPAHTSVVYNLSLANGTVRSKEDKLQIIMGKYAGCKGKVSMLEKTVEDLREKSNSKVTALSIETERIKSESATSISSLRLQLSVEEEAGRKLGGFEQLVKDLRRTNEDLSRKNEELVRKNVDLLRNRVAELTTVNASDNESVTDTKGQALIKKLTSQLEDVTALSDSIIPEIDDLAEQLEVLKKTNLRMTKQGIEKEELYNNAISEMMKLKRSVDLLTTEKSVLQGKIKNYEQLNVASRAAVATTKALEEEFKKREKANEEMTDKFEKQVAQLTDDKNKSDAEVVKVKSTVGNSESEVEGLTKRCDVLSEEQSGLQDDVSKLKIELASAKESVANYASAASDEHSHSHSNGGASAGSYDSKILLLQINQYKSKLRCNVCNEKDKSCLLAKCNHMFCRSCIDTRIENRDRKCPSCMTRFDKGDVKDIGFNLS